MYSYQLEVRHEALHKYRVIRGRDPYVVQEKARVQLQQWEDMWSNRQEKERRRQDAHAAAEERAAKKEDANEQTAAAQSALDVAKGLLMQSLQVNDTIAWDELKDARPFPSPRPEEPPARQPPPLPPNPKHLRYKPNLTFFDRLFGGRVERKEAAAKAAFQADLRTWEKACGLEHARTEQASSEFATRRRQWELEREAFQVSQNAHNMAVDETRGRYLASEPEAIEEYCDLVLSKSAYPDWLPQEWQLEYLPQSKILVVEYALPALDTIPTLKEVKYIQSRDEFTSAHISEREMAALYDSIVYQVALRTLHELSEADTIDALSSVVFNGWVQSTDRSTGLEAKACILSVQAKKSEYMAINLAQVDPKACFRKLKGIGSSQLHSLTPVAPILTLQREDKRFVPSHGVVGTLNEGVNLASIDWEEFEHLVRELFEKEFARDGAEVRVTRASRDGGVDAVIFDPDPIRGGKIVIQAKRYTNTVGVSAVRDLYGTLMNEGAMKGILVATSDYGPDSYEFAKDKPISLLNGANLLHLLNKHGHAAHIDLKKARGDRGASGS